MLLPELIYYCGYLLKKRYDIRRQRSLPHRVISIGNLTIGGTGKTPATIAIAEEAKRRGFYPVILTRGYRGTIKGPHIVSKGDGPLMLPDEAGDEAFLMSQRLKGIPIIKSPDRYRGGRFAIDNLNDHERIIFILDDGFQHLRLFRDVDILLVDGMNPFGNRRLLPLGRLREPLREIKRADLIVITRSLNLPGSLIQEIRRYNDKAPIFSSYHKPSCFRGMNGKVIPEKDLSGKCAIAFCGIGNPHSFKRSIIDLGIDLKDFIIFGDHHRYSHHDIERIERIAERSKADWIITTEKDIIKIKNLGVYSNILYLTIEFEIEENFFEEVFNRV